MDDLRRRFHRLDRVEAPYLWNEAISRAAALELAPRRAFSPGLGLVATALLLMTVVGTVAVGAWLDRSTPGPKIVTYDNGLLVARDGCGELIAIDPTSLEQRDLGATPGACPRTVTPPAWSRDGSHLVYAVPREGGTVEAAGIWLYESGSGDTRQLVGCGDNDSCDFWGIDISPDASLVAYLGLGEGRGAAQELIVRVIESGAELRVPLTGSAGRPVFSPDGDQIALAQLGGKSGVYLVDVRGVDDGVIGEPHMAHGTVEAADLTWSPDGQWIAMTQTGGLGRLGDDHPGTQQVQLSGRGVVILNAATLETRVLATLPAETWGAWPTWSADSSAIAYGARPIDEPTRGQRFELWTVTIDGGEPTRIYDSGCCIDSSAAPVWSPDGSWIAFGVGVPGDDAGSGTFLIRPDGSGMQRVSRGVLDVAWQPIPRE